MTKPKNIYQRLHDVMQKVDYVQKGEKSGMQYKFVSHDAVTAKVRKPLVEAGVVYHPYNLRLTQNGNRTEVLLDIRFVNVDEPTDFVDVPSAGFGIDNQDKGIGKAISYAVKYALLKALGLETGDDPERDNIDHESNKEPTKEVYSKQRGMINAINSFKDKLALASWYVENERDVNDLPANEMQLVMDQYEARLTQFDNGVVIASAFKFEGVKEQDEWGAAAKAEISRCDTLAELAEWQERNKPKLMGLERKRKERMTEIVGARMKEIEANSKTNLGAG